MEPATATTQEQTTATRVGLPVFDAHHPPSAELISDCVHCGFCLSTCPTYLLWGQEADSPRGRIYLMKLGLEGEAELSPTYVKHFDQCLGCMACLTSCPSGVQYDKLIEATRSQIERRFPRSAFERIFRRLLFSIFPHPARLWVLALPLWIYQRSGLRRLVRGIGLVSLLPVRLQAMDDLLPTVVLSGLKGRAHPPQVAGKKRLRVGLVLGCVQRVFFDAVNQATARVLAAEGCDVVIPKQQGCCGALMLHAGEEPSAIAFAKRMIDTFEAENVEVVAINAAGCGSAMKEYGHLLRDDPQYAERAKVFAGKCRDISEILAQLSPQAVRHPIALRVAYHDACHLQHAQRITAQPRQILKTIPELEIVEIAESAICCGSAGIYNLLQPQAARQLGARKTEHVMATGADAVVTGNPGCLLQIQCGLEAAGKAMPVLHWVQLLDASISGTIPVRKLDTEKIKHEGTKTRSKKQ